MTTYREIAYRLNPVSWARDVLGIAPHDWQQRFLLAPRGASIAVLTARQVGKTTAAAVAMAHSAIFSPKSLSVVACPTQNQSAEALRKVCDMVLKVGAELTADNVFKLELANGSRVLALPDTEESIRGLTVDAWIVADEAARLKPNIMAALHPMRTQRPNARFVMLSTAWSRTDPFWSVWENDDPSWMRIRATIDVEPNLVTPEALKKARGQLSADDFKREYLGVPAGSQVSPFTSELYKRATQTPVHRHMWDFFKPYIIAHDVGHTKDRSTAVIGGPSLLAPGLIGIKGFEELPQGLSGNTRADALATASQFAKTPQFSRDTLLFLAPGKRGSGRKVMPTNAAPCSRVTSALRTASGTNVQRYYNEVGTHLWLRNDVPIPRAVRSAGHIITVLHQQYVCV